MPLRGISWWSNALRRGYAVKCVKIGLKRAKRVCGVLGQGRAIMPLKRKIWLYRAIVGRSCRLAVLSMGGGACRDVAIRGSTPPYPVARACRGGVTPPFRMQIFFKGF